MMTQNSDKKREQIQLLCMDELVKSFLNNYTFVLRCDII